MRLLFIVLALVFMFPQVSFALSPEQKRVIDSGAYYFNVEASGFSVDGSNSCSLATMPAISDTSGVAAAIDEFIIGHGGTGSPFEGLGTDIVEGAVRAGINPFLIVSIALKESSFGTAGIATRDTYNAFGRTASDSQPNVNINGRNWYRWDSWEASVNSSEDNQAEFLKRVYVEDRGLTDLTEVIFTYAPPSENNTELYAEQINDWVNELVTASGSALTCGASAGEGGDPEANRQIAREMLADYGWAGSQFECLDNIWSQESGWNHEADNPDSSAYGIPQALMGIAKPNIDENYPDFYEREIQVTPGVPKTYNYEGGNPATQIKWGLDYINGRYGTPCDAWEFKQAEGWY